MLLNLLTKNSGHTVVKIFTGLMYGVLSFGCLGHSEVVSGFPFLSVYSFLENKSKALLPLYHNWTVYTSVHHSLTFCMILV